MREKFVWVWWAGCVRDTFADTSIFKVSRFGSLRVRRERGARRVERGSVARRDAAPTAAPRVQVQGVV